MARPSQREHILDAAEQVVITRGAARLTLDAVAAAAGVGKGGLIYHFPSKLALLKGLIERMAGTYEASVAAAGADPAAGRAPVRTQVAALIAVHERSQQLATALVAVAANEPGLLAEVRERQQGYLARMLAGSGGSRAVALMLAVDGLFLLEHLGMRPLKLGDRRRVLDAILEQAAALDAGSEPA